jgi:CheY-like chemotaxis protein
MQTLQCKRPVLGIALTGFGMEDDVRKCRDAGFQHHLVKPIDLNKLDLLIQESAASARTRIRFHSLLSRIVNRSDVTLPSAATLCALAFPPGTREHAGKFEDS